MDTSNPPDDDTGNENEVIDDTAQDDDDNIDDDNNGFEADLNNDAIDPDILATIAALGSFEGSNYVKGEECAICVTDLIKFLRLEDKKTCDIRIQLALSRVMEKDLLPILTTYFDEHDIIDPLIRLIVNLTMPVLLCFEKEETIKIDKLRTKLHLEVNGYLRSYKHQFVVFNVMKIFSTQLGHLLKLGRTNRNDEDDLMLERILIIIRNILHVPADSHEDLQLQHSLSVHDKLVLSLIEYGVADLLLYLCGNKEEEQHCLLALEIISLIFRDFDAKTLALQNTNYDQSKVDKELQEIKQREALQKQKNVRTKNTRHSRFGGTFVVCGKKSITEKDLIYHKNIKKIKDLSFDDEKTIQRHSRHNAIAEDQSEYRSSTVETRQKLKGLAQKFLDVCYNLLMKKAKSLLCRGQTSSDTDESFYIWACTFFMEFNRYSGFKLELVAETLSIDTFSYVLQIIFKMHENLKGFSAKMVDQMLECNKRLHKAVKAYREMLENLSLMLSSSDSKIRSIASVIQNNIFYQQEYRELPTLLLKQFHKRFCTKTYLVDLIECTHIYIKMLEVFTKDNTLIVQETKKKAKKKSVKKKKKNLLSEREMKEMWEGDIEKEVLNVLSSAKISTMNVRPFDASSDYSLEQQRITCKHKIQDLLKSGSFDEAVAMYKAAQEVWPNSPSFGMPDMAIIDEVNVMKSIFMSNEDVPDFVSNDINEERNQQEDPRTSEITASEIHSVKEQKFENTNYLMLYARPGIVQSYCYLLQFFETNSFLTNHATVKMLYRLATKLAMTPLMYQISFFITLRKILAAPKVDSFKELKKFAAYIVRKFTVSIKESPMMCVDTVFWKTTDDVVMIDHGYDGDKLPNNKQSVQWTSQEEEEIKTLYDKWIDKARAIDLCEMIAQDMTTSSDKSRMDVKKKIIELKLVTEGNADILKKKPKNKVEWLPDEREALRNLYEEFQYERDPVALIQEKLDTKSRKKIIKELETLLGVRKCDLSTSRSIWNKDDDEELRILYGHLSETHTGTSLLDHIQEKIPKPRTAKEIKDALVRLKLQRDESSSSHFWTKGELAVITKYEKLLSKKETVLNIRRDLPHIDNSCVIQQLVHMGQLTTMEGAQLLMELSDIDSDAKSEEEDEEEEEYDFFDIPKHLRKLEHCQEAIKWLAGICQNILSNREDLLDYDTVFIIPTQDEHGDALGDATFQDLLKCLGAVPPLSSCENYWKITSDVSDNLLSKGLGLLTGRDVLSDAESDVETYTTPAPLQESSEDDDMDDFLSKMRSQGPPEVSKRKAFVESDAEDDLIRPSSNSLTKDSQLLMEEELSDKENNPISQPSKRKSGQISDSDSGADETFHKKKRTVMIQDFSDSD